MKPYFNDITQAGYHQIQQEILQCQAQRPARIKALQVARALGDLSENADYSAAKRDLRHLESRLRYLEKQLRYAKIVTPTDNDQIEIGKDVVLEFLDDHEQETYHLVGLPEADLPNYKITLASPLGRALKQQRPGAIVTVTAPAGDYQVKIIDVFLS
ncbi:transcription elongation factor GreA [Agrilactobacillus yilanensis]|uniref:Transcription elongation factor GreA n=1 Tax=Agrilactobacillus yilanensis TaxID=2485997 RepID=A0ABW4J601_9LACO|nr:transcription elongation factor GreA [Agrilactobacillus yilanensis]